MAEEAKQKIWDLNLKKINPNREEQDHHWVASMAMGEGSDEDVREPTSSTDQSSMEQDSSNSALFSSSTDLVEDASSSTSSSSSSTLISHTNKGPLYELSVIMAQLPIKRGLSKFYQGKSQSYTSLARVKSIEDLAKKVTNPYRSKMKSCNSYGGLVFDAHKSYSPKPTISKKASRGSFLSSSSKKAPLESDY